nr:immunoglobulin light chain junction region [Macaca mulatta]
CQHSYNAPRTF